MCVCVFVCLCVCVCVCVSLRMYVLLCVCMHMYACMHACMYLWDIHAYIHTYIHLCRAAEWSLVEVVVREAVQARAESVWRRVESAVIHLTAARARPARRLVLASLERTLAESLCSSRGAFAGEMAGAPRAGAGAAGAVSATGDMQAYARLSSLLLVLHRL